MAGFGSLQRKRKGVSQWHCLASALPCAPAPALTWQSLQVGGSNQEVVGFGLVLAVLPHSEPGDGEVVAEDPEQPSLGAGTALHPYPAGTPAQGLGDVGCSYWGIRGQSRMGTAFMQPEPRLPDEDGDDENSSQDEEGEDPKGDQDGHLLQRVAAVWDRKLSRPRDATDPGTWRGLGTCTQPSPQPHPRPPALLTDGLRVGSLRGLLCQALQAGICSGSFTRCGGRVWEGSRVGNQSPKSGSSVTQNQG